MLFIPLTKKIQDQDSWYQINQCVECFLSWFLLSLSIVSSLITKSKMLILADMSLFSTIVFLSKIIIAHWSLEHMGFCIFLNIYKYCTISYYRTFPYLINCIIVQSANYFLIFIIDLGFIYSNNLFPQLSYKLNV